MRQFATVRTVKEVGQAGALTDALAARGFTVECTIEAGAARIMVPVDDLENALAAMRRDRL